MFFKAKRLLVPLLVLWLGILGGLAAVALGVLWVVYFTRGRFHGTILR